MLCPADNKQFRKLAALSGELHALHLLESLAPETPIIGYPETGGTAVPETAWNFHIGGYQPAQKWLKDRKNRTLDHNDITHYQKIIIALTETDRLMQEIDKVSKD